jgi:hypothetical protein
VMVGPGISFSKQTVRTSSEWMAELFSETKFRVPHPSRSSRRVG